MTARTVAAGRRPQGVRTLAFAVTFTILAGVVVLGMWRFISPPASASALSEVRLAPASDFALGSVTAYRITRDGEITPIADTQLQPSIGVASEPGFASGISLFYVVRLPNSEVRVFSGASTHLREAVFWYPNLEWGDYVGMFYQPGHSERWAIDGTRLYGPQPRDLDRYEAHIDENGVLVIDLSEVIRSDYRTSGAPVASYNVLDPEWPISGWPGRRP